jgi:hypothetical protein
MVAMARTILREMTKATRAADHAAVSAYNAMSPADRLKRR